MGAWVNSQTIDVRVSGIGGSRSLVGDWFSQKVEFEVFSHLTKNSESTIRSVSWMVCNNNRQSPRVAQLVSRPCIKASPTSSPWSRPNDCVLANQFPHVKNWCDWRSFQISAVIIYTSYNKSEVTILGMTC